MFCFECGYYLEDCHCDPRVVAKDDNGQWIDVTQEDHSEMR